MTSLGLADNRVAKTVAEYRAAQKKVSEYDVAYASKLETEIGAHLKHGRQLAAARLKLRLAELDQQQFLITESKQKQGELTATIELAKQRHKQAIERVKWSKHLANAGLISQVNLDLDVAAEKRAQSQLDSTSAQLRLYRSTTLPRLKLETEDLTAQAQDALALLESQFRAEAKRYHSASERALIALQGARKQVESAAESNKAPQQPPIMSDDVQAAHDALEEARTKRDAMREFLKAKLKRSDNAIQAAELALAEYRTGESHQTLRKQRNNVRSLEESVESARERLAWTQRVLRKGYITATQLETDRIAVSEKELALKVARNELQRVEQHQLKRQELMLTGRILELKDERQRLKRFNAAQLGVVEANVRALSISYELERFRNSIPRRTETKSAAGGG